MTAPDTIMSHGRGVETVQCVESRSFFSVRVLGAARQPRGWIQSPLRRSGHVDVNADQDWHVLERHAVGDGPTTVAALGHIALVSEPSHQGSQARTDMIGNPPAAIGFSEKSKPGTEGTTRWKHPQRRVAEMSCLFCSGGSHAERRGHSNRDALATGYLNSPRA